MPRRDVSSGVLPGAMVALFVLCAAGLAADKPKPAAKPATPAKAATPAGRGAPGAGRALRRPGEAAPPGGALRRRREAAPGGGERLRRDGVRRGRVAAALCGPRAAGTHRREDEASRGATGIGQRSTAAAAYATCTQTEWIFIMVPAAAAWWSGTGRVAYGW